MTQLTITEASLDDSKNRLSHSAAIPEGAVLIALCNSAWNESFVRSDNIEDILLSAAFLVICFFNLLR